MMTRNHGKIEFECEGCNEVLDSETEDFSEARMKLRAEHWSSVKAGNEWEHYCSSCSKAETKW